MLRTAPRWVVWSLGVLAGLGWLLLTFVFAIGNTVLAHNHWWNDNVDWFGVGGFITGFGGTWAWIAVAGRNLELDAAYGKGAQPAEASDATLFHAPIDEFLPDDRIRVRALRRAVQVVSAAATIACGVATIQIFTTDVAETGPGGVSAVFVIAAVIAIVGFVVGDQLVTNGPHIRAMREQLSTSSVWVNRTMPSIKTWAAMTHPESKARISGVTFIVLTTRQLSLWSPAAGQLRNVVAVPRGQIESVRRDQAGALTNYAGLVVTVQTADQQRHELVLAPSVNAASGLNGKQAVDDLIQLLGVPETTTEQK